MPQTTATNNTTTTSTIMSKEATSMPQQQQQQQQQETLPSTMPLSPRTAAAAAQHGDVVTIDLNLTPEHGYVPHPLFDTQGRITFVLGWGNYLPGLHTLLLLGDDDDDDDDGMKVGDSIEGISIDAGWGKRRQDLIVTVPKSNLKSLQDVSVVKVGCQLHLEVGGTIQVLLVTEVTEDTITVDANPPLAGASYRCDELTVVNIESMDTYEIATFGLGCFWGAQLAFARTPGVVGTKSGYTQGICDDPTYEQVCEGKTRHREAVMVVYNPKEVSYEELMKVAIERLDQTTADVFSLHDMFSDDDDDDDHSSEQYRHGFYYHNEEQRRLAQELLDKDNNRYRIELLPSAKFFNAEEYHQHYLLKGGQSARKGAKEPIRCFG